MGFSKNKILHKAKIEITEMNLNIREITGVVSIKMMFLKLLPIKNGIPEKDRNPTKKAIYKLIGTAFLPF